ncbi:MAG: hypothetical protein WD847_09035 [Pirellulales bacterium]
MNGATSLRGLAGYQQRYVTYRVLGALGMRVLAQDWTEPILTEFSIEGRSSEGAPSWDVGFAFTGGIVDLHECKDTKITRPDRLAFYDRLRKEVASGTHADRVRPLWVTDPDKQTPNTLTYLGGIAEAVENLDLADVPNSLPVRMDSTDDAIQEAVYRLCHYAGEEDGGKKKVPRPCTFEEARSLLRQLGIARHRFEDLDQSVKLLLTGVFAKGSADAVDKFVTGVLTNEIVQKGEARFTVDTFIQAVGTTTLELEVEGRIRNLLSFCAASGFRQRIRLVQWSRLAGRPTTRWTLAERAPEYSPGQSYLIVAGMGVGKTVTSQMAFDEEAGRRHPGRVLRVESRTLDRDGLEAVVRLACMLCGVGPTWLALDGLDEVSHELRKDWERALGALTALPNLALLVTVRREVLAVREWLGNATSPLTRVDILPLEPRQVEAAFGEVGLPVPTNPRLVQVLQNPFLLSLYADVVTPDDMPLAESGEVTAFRVIDEFWKRRVRGVSEGQRAVGDSEGSQESKRQAAVLLGDRSLEGELAVTRNSTNPQVVEGVQMLLREGVIRERGAGAVAWIHEWLREYALLDRLLSRCEAASAVTIARRVVADCPIDHVARSGAAGAMKWVLANPDAGSPTEFLSELWSHNRGLAREALAVVLEGSPSATVLGDLSDDLLVEAVTQAVHLGATQWVNQVAQLDHARFFGSHGNELHAITVEYELQVAPGTGESASEAVRRLASRDLARLRAGHSTTRRTIKTVLARVISTESFRDPATREWLVTLAEIVDGYDFGELLKAVTAIVATGEVTGAHAVYRAIAGFTVSVRGDAIAEVLVSRRFVFGDDLINILHTPGLIAGNVGTWGKTAIEFVAKLVEVKQRLRWPSSRRLLSALAEATGTDFPVEAEFAPRFDEDARLTTLDADKEGKPIVRIAAAISQAFGELAQLDDPSAFRELADVAFGARFAAVVALPLLVLYDSACGAAPRKDWHVMETVRLLSNDSVAQVESLDDVRRLHRRRLAANLDQELKQAVVDAIRRSGIRVDVLIRELSDVRPWGILTPEEEAEVTRAAAAGEISEPADPREEKLFRVHRGVSPDLLGRGTGWPHQEDDGLIRLLQRAESEPDEPVPGGLEVNPLVRQLQALGVVLQRPEATGEEWLGRSLGWCHRAIERLRRSVEPENGDDSGEAAQ